MEYREPDWHPSTQEVADILQELRPIIAEIAHRDELELAFAGPLQCTA